MVCMFRKMKDVKHHPTTEKKIYKEILHFCGLWTKKGNLQFFYNQTFDLKVFPCSPGSTNKRLL